MPIRAWQHQCFIIICMYCTCKWHYTYVHTCMYIHISLTSALSLSTYIAKKMHNLFPSQTPDCVTSLRGCLSCPVPLEILWHRKCSTWPGVQRWRLPPSYSQTSMQPHSQVYNICIHVPTWKFSSKSSRISLNGLHVHVRMYTTCMYLHNRDAESCSLQKCANTCTRANSFVKT